MGAPPVRRRTGPLRRHLAGVSDRVGKKKFDNVHIEPDESPPIAWDNQHPAFFSAMVKMDYGDMPRPADLAAWRTYCSITTFHPKAR